MDSEWMPSVDGGGDGDGSDAMAFQHENDANGRILLPLCAYGGL